LVLRHTFNNIISVDNLLESWKEFLRGKRKRKDVVMFSVHLADNILDLHWELYNKTYQHGLYHAFKINDPKPRDIHKANVRDRLVHRAIYRILYSYFDKKFIFDSYSCRCRKGTHRAINRFRQYTLIVSKNNTKTVWVLKCDIRKFFANINHNILKDIFLKHITDSDIIWLLGCVVDSFNTQDKIGVGLPLGNLTSQLFVNIYMNEFDQFVKRKLKAKYYIRYADDFVIFSQDKKWLEEILKRIKLFLIEELKLELHPDKVFIKTFVSGIDFLGWINFSHHKMLRTTTKKRMFKKVSFNPVSEMLNSYLGLLKHGNTYKIRRNLINNYKNKNLNLGEH